MERNKVLLRMSLRQHKQRDGKSNTSIRSVSYTHLEVTEEEMKRQEQLRRHRIKSRERYQKIKSGEHIIGEPFQLDVYKRQFITDTDIGFGYAVCFIKVRCSRTGIYCQ